MFQEKCLQVSWFQLVPRSEAAWAPGLFQTSEAPALPCRSSESETIRNRPIPSRPWHPVAVNLNALVSLRRSSCLFVDNSFSFVFFRLFQTSVAPALPCRSYESETIRNRPIPSRSWYPVTVNLNALVALRRPSCVFVDSSLSFVLFFGCFRQAGLRGLALSALCCRRLRGSTWSYPFPWAYAHGYLLPPLRGSMGRPGVRPGTIKY